MRISSHINSVLFIYHSRKTPGGILAKVGFHFRRSEHNPISHIRFIVSRGHLSSLKVDKHYFKILKISGKVVSVFIARHNYTSLYKAKMLNSNLRCFQPNSLMRTTRSSQQKHQASRNSQIMNRKALYRNKKLNRPL